MDGEISNGVIKLMSIFSFWRPSTSHARRRTPARSAGLENCTAFYAVGPPELKRAGENMSSDDAKSTARTRRVVPIRQPAAGVPAQPSVHQPAILFVVAAERPPAIQALMARGQDDVGEAEPAPADSTGEVAVAATDAVSSQSVAIRAPSVVWLSPATLSRTCDGQFLARVFFCSRCQCGPRFWIHSVPSDADLAWPWDCIIVWQSCN